MTNLNDSGAGSRREVITSANAAPSISFDGFGIRNLIGLDASTVPGTYTLLGGTANFDFSNVANFGLENAYDLGQGKLAYFQSGSLQLVFIPEPSSIALIVLGLAGWMLFRRGFKTSPTS